MLFPRCCSLYPKFQNIFQIIHCFWFQKTCICFFFKLLTWPFLPANFKNWWTIMLRKKYLLNRTLIFYLSLFPSLFFLLCYLRLLLSEFYLSIIFHNYGNFFLLFFQAVSSIGKRILLVQFPSPNPRQKKIIPQNNVFYFLKKMIP